MKCLRNHHPKKSSDAVKLNKFFSSPLSCRHFFFCPHRPSMPSLHHYKSKLRKDFFGDDAGLIGVYVNWYVSHWQLWDLQSNVMSIDYGSFVVDDFIMFCFFVCFCCNFVCFGDGELCRTNVLTMPQNQTLSQNRVTTHTFLRVSMLGTIVLHLSFFLDMWQSWWKMGQFPSSSSTCDVATIHRTQIHIAAQRYCQRFYGQVIYENSCWQRFSFFISYRVQVLHVPNIM